MNKLKELYRKHELAFAIFWIVLYTVCMGNLRRLGDDSPILMIGLIVISSLMMGVLWSTFPYSAIIAAYSGMRSGASAHKRANDFLPSMIWHRYP